MQYSPQSKVAAALASVSTINQLPINLYLMLSNLGHDVDWMNRSQSNRENTHYSFQSNSDGERSNNQQHHSSSSIQRGNATARNPHTTSHHTELHPLRCSICSCRRASAPIRILARSMHRW